MGDIREANKKGTSQNLLAEAKKKMKNFMKKTRKLNGWDHELDEEAAKKYVKN